MKTFQNTQSVVPDDFLPASIRDMRAISEKIITSTSRGIVEQISELRDFAEHERYREKNEVDDYLLHSADTDSVCLRIKDLFKVNDCIVAAKEYLNLFSTDMKALHDFHVKAALT